MLQRADLWASAFSAGLERGELAPFGRRLHVLRFSQPLRPKVWRWS